MAGGGGKAGLNVGIGLPADLGGGGRVMYLTELPKPSSHSVDSKLGAQRVLEVRQPMLAGAGRGWQRKQARMRERRW